MADAYGVLYLLRHDLETLFRVWFLIVVLTDSITLLNLLIHTSTVSTEKRLMIDISALRQAFDRSLM